MTGEVRAEGWLIKSRDHGIRFPLLKSKWARRYYKIRRDASSHVYCLDEYADETQRRLRKSIKLEQVEQIDSYLRLAQSSCVSRGALQLQWIFAIHTPRRTEGKVAELYFAAESENDMNVWVCNLCRACGLRRQDEAVNTAVRGEGWSPPSMEIPSVRQMDEQSLASTIPSEMSSVRAAPSRSYQVEPPPRQNYQHLRNFHSPLPYSSAASKRPPHLRSESGADGCSLSSTNSSHASLSTEEDNSSCSGVLPRPPYVPPRSRTLERPSSSSSRNNDANGFTPLHAKGSVNERGADWDGRADSSNADDLPVAPPIVDRSLKPRLPAIPKTTPRVRHHNITTPTSSHSTTQFEYVEPMEMGAPATPRANAVPASLPQHELDYIKIDAHQTQAIKHTLARGRPE